MTLNRNRYGWRLLFPLVGCLLLVVLCACIHAEEPEKKVIERGTYSDDFSDPNSGWEVRDETGYKRGYRDGIYELVIKQNKLACYTYAPIKIRGNSYSVQVEFRYLRDIDGMTGIVFNRVKDVGSTVLAVSAKSEQFSVTNFARGGNTTLFGWTTRKAINKPKEVNKVKVTQANNKAQFYINDSLVGEAEILTSPKDECEVGLFAQTTESDMTMIFDNFVVTVP